MRTIKLHIEGTHCQGCKARIEATIGALPGVKAVAVDWSSGASSVEYDEQVLKRETIVAAIERLDYSVNPEQSSMPAGAAQRWILGGLLLVAIAAVYVLVERSGALDLMARLNDERLGYGVIFLIGLLASVHCVGMCGGLVVAYTATGPTQGRHAWGPHLQYNLGRLLSYTAIGAVLGGFGSFFGINPAFSGLLTLVVGGVMTLMGLSLLTNWQWLNNFGPLSAVARYLYGQPSGGKASGPFVIGLINGFMPCGPLQAMQLYALGSGSAGTGALSMAAYALGTVPLMFGFGNVISLLSRERVSQVVKLSGVIIVVLGLLMIGRGLDNFGVGLPLGATPPVANATATTAPVASKPTVTAPAPPVKATPVPAGNVQTVTMDVTYQGFVPNTLRIKPGVPVRWVINAKQITRCTNEIIMPQYNIDVKLQQGQSYVVEFTPTGTGEQRFSCWMRMVWGRFIVG